jgi:hypothetical protein
VSGRYRINRGKDEGHGSFHLHDEGGWVETFQKIQAAGTEKAAREQYDRVRQGE